MWENRLSLIASKSVCMFLGASKQLRKISGIGNIMLDEDEIKREDETKYMAMTTVEPTNYSR